MVIKNTVIKNTVIKNTAIKYDTKRKYNSMQHKNKYKKTLKRLSQPSLQSIIHGGITTDKVIDIGNKFFEKVVKMITSHLSIYKKYPSVHLDEYGDLNKVDNELVILENNSFYDENQLPIFSLLNEYLQVDNDIKQKLILYVIGLDTSPYWNDGIECERFEKSEVLFVSNILFVGNNIALDFLDIWENNTTSPLLLAVSKKKPYIVNFLLKNTSIKINETDKDGKNALDLSILNFIELSNANVSQENVKNESEIKFNESIIGKLWQSFEKGEPGTSKTEPGTSKTEPQKAPTPTPKGESLITIKYVHNTEKHLYTIRECAMSFFTAFTDAIVDKTNKSGKMINPQIKVSRENLDAKDPSDTNKNTTYFQSFMKLLNKEKRFKTKNGIFKTGIPLQGPDELKIYLCFTIWLNIRTDAKSNGLNKEQFTEKYKDLSFFNLISPLFVEPKTEKTISSIIETSWLNIKKENYIIDKLFIEELAKLFNITIYITSLNETIYNESDTVSQYIYLYGNVLSNLEKTDGSDGVIYNAVEYRGKTLFVNSDNTTLLSEIRNEIYRVRSNNNTSSSAEIEPTPADEATINEINEAFKQNADETKKAEEAPTEEQAGGGVRNDGGINESFLFSKREGGAGENTGKKLSYNVFYTLEKKSLLILIYLLRASGNLYYSKDILSTNYTLINSSFENAFNTLTDADVLQHITKHCAFFKRENKARYIRLAFFAKEENIKKYIDEKVAKFLTTFYVSLVDDIKRNFTGKNNNIDDVILQEHCFAYGSIERVLSKFNMVDIDSGTNRKTLFHYASQYGSTDLLKILKYSCEILETDEIARYKLLYNNLQKSYTYYYELETKEVTNMENIEWKSEIIKLASIFSRKKYTTESIKINQDGGDIILLFLQSIKQDEITNKTCNLLFLYANTIHYKLQDLKGIGLNLKSINRKELKHYINGIDDLLNSI